MSRYTFFMPSKGEWQFDKKSEYPECKVWDENTDLEKEFEEFQARYDALVEKRAEGLIEGATISFFLQPHFITVIDALIEKQFEEAGNRWTRDECARRLVTESLRQWRDRTP